MCFLVKLQMCDSQIFPICFYRVKELSHFALSFITLMNKWACYWLREFFLNLSYSVKYIQLTTNSDKLGQNEVKHQIRQSNEPAESCSGWVFSSSKLYESTENWRNRRNLSTLKKTKLVLDFYCILQNRLTATLYKTVFILIEIITMEDFSFTVYMRWMLVRSDVYIHWHSWLEELCETQKRNWNNLHLSSFSKENGARVNFFYKPFSS